MSKSKVFVSGPGPALPQVLKLVYCLSYDLLTHMSQLCAGFLRPKRKYGCGQAKSALQKERTELVFYLAKFFMGKTLYSGT